MATIRRNKYGRLVYATAILGTTVTGWSTDPAAAVQVEEAAARLVVDTHKAKDSPNGGQIAAVDAKGKTIALWGEPGEEPKPVAPPPVSLPGLAERVRVVEERVEMIEAADGAGVDPASIDAALAKAVKGMPLLLKSDVPAPQFTADEAAALKGMLGEWAAHKAAAAAKEKNERKEQPVRGEHKAPANTAATVPAG